MSHLLQAIHKINCKGPQTNMPQNVGSKEDMINKNIPKRHIGFCNADRITWKLTLQDMNTTPRESKTERGCSCRQLFRRADPGFFLGGGALVSCSTWTPINHIVFLLQNTSCIRKPQVISVGEGGAHPLHPPPRSAPDYTTIQYFIQEIKTKITKYLSKGDI